VTQGDFAGADRILAEQAFRGPDPELDAITAWVRNNLTGRHEGPLKALDALLRDNAACEHALYYRGLVLARAGDTRGALRDLVALAKQNPRHARALLEIQRLRPMLDPKG
jgi:hypothetical protein